STVQLRQHFELLAQRLLDLTAQSRQAGAVIALIEEVADQTHLLALNAAVQAGGGLDAGVVSAAASSHSYLTSPHFTMLSGLGSSSPRFGVIAQHIQALAQRSYAATVAARELIGEMQGAVAAAVLVAEEGRKETF